MLYNEFKWGGGGVIVKYSGSLMVRTKQKVNKE